MKYRLFSLFILLVSGFASLSQDTGGAKKISSSQSYDSITIKSININSAQSDFCPFFTGDNLLFTSGRTKQFGVVYSSAKSDNELVDLYLCKKNDSISFSLPKAMPEIINSKYNDGPAWINKNLDRIYFTSLNKKGVSKKNNEGTLQISFSEIKNGKWTVPKKLSFCENSFSYCHPFLMDNEKTIIFSSNKDGGFGGMDLYISKFENEKWSQPVSFGAKINSADNEVFPFVSKSNVLYFASNKSSGLGGLDIYSFNLKDFAKAKLQLLENPINTSFDDFGISIDSLNQTGYFSSNRNKATSDDIFYFHKNITEQFTHCNPYKNDNYCYSFFQESPFQSKERPGLNYEWNFGDGIKVKGSEAKHCYAKPGIYAIELNIVDAATDEIFYNEKNYSLKVDNPSPLRINCDDSVTVNSEVSFNTEKSFIPTHTIISYFWDFGDGSNEYVSNVSHTFTKKGTYTIQLAATTKNDSTAKEEKYCTEKKIIVVDFVAKKNKDGKVFKYSLLDYDLDSLKQVSPNDTGSFRVFLFESKKQIPLTDKIFKGLKDVKEIRNEKNNTYRYVSGNVKTIAEAMQYYNDAKSKGFANVALLKYDKKNKSNTLGAKIIVIEKATDGKGKTFNYFLLPYSRQCIKRSAGNGYGQ